MATGHLIAGITGRSRTNRQGNGCRQRWHAYPRGDAGLDAGDQLGSAALGAGAPPSGRSHSAALMKACRTEPVSAVKNSSGRL